MRTANLNDVAIFVSALGAGLMAGFFFAFSILVMKALGAIQPAHGISAMQSINVVVINPWFLTPFFGTALLCVILSVTALLRWHEPGAAFVLAAGLLYLLGTIGVTMLFNVPRNNALAAVAPTSAHQRGRGGAVGGLYRRLDAVEPRANHRRIRRRRRVYDCVDAVTIAD